jgi:3-hydroxyisobutyrate dehydrogenase-like beta-hydroxyacid dehydrogenase
MATVGLLHPGEMGAAVGGRLVTAGHTVLWDPSGRSRATTGRALAAELTGVEFGALVSRGSVIFSICPPHAALDVAREVAAAGFGGVYVDANAISVATAAQVSSVVTAGGAAYVDGGIIGPPPDGARADSSRTRLYLSGARAGEVRALFTRSALDARIADGPLYAASAVKMAYAAWTKGSGALLLACRALARAEGVERTLLAEWAMSQPGLEARSEGSAAAAAAKGWRWVAEMEEIAASMDAAGLPSGFHQAAAEIYDRAAHADTQKADGKPRAGVAPGASRVRSDESDFSSTLDTVISALM